jgi:hypothetical protein
MFFDMTLNVFHENKLPTIPHVLNRNL